MRADVDFLFVHLARDGLTTIRILNVLVLLVHRRVQLHQLYLLIVQQHLLLSLVCRVGHHDLLAAGTVAGSATSGSTSMHNLAHAGTARAIMMLMSAE